MKVVISEEEALEHLRRACEGAGSANKLAAELEVSPAFISKMLNGHAAITGVVAKHLRLVSVNAYQLTLIEPNPKQEQYEKRRRAWLKLNGMNPYDRTGIR